MESLIQQVVPQTEATTHETNPFSPSEVYFKVSPKLFGVLPDLPTVSREILRYITFNLSEGKVFLPVSSLIVHSKVKSEQLIRAGIDALVDNEVLALYEGECYWVNFIEPAE